MRNSTGWTTGARKGTSTGRLRRNGASLIILGAFALIAAGAVSQIGGARTGTIALLVVGVVACLAGWRMLVLGRRRERPLA